MLPYGVSARSPYRLEQVESQAACPRASLTTDEGVGVDVCANMDVGNGSGRIGRMMSAERRLRKGVDSIMRRMYRRRRDVGKGTSALGLRDEPNTRTSTSWPMLSLRVRRSHERLTLSHVVFINAGDVKRQSHTWTGPGPDRDEGQQRAFQCGTPSLELVAFRLAFHKVTAHGQLRSHSR